MKVPEGFDVWAWTCNICGHSLWHHSESDKCQFGKCRCKERGLVG